MILSGQFKEPEPEHLLRSVRKVFAIEGLAISITINRLTVTLCK